MGLIHQMDEHLATLIAAGEVITGPASVVRELVDNALDAGAAHVEVTLEEGGLRTVRVADDGSGMDPADAVLCLSRHATSKITAAGDLESIRTRGFRGEALAAILSVSRLRIETRRGEEEAGTLVVGAGGEVVDVRATARRPGTTVEVGHLFFNTPARREFQDTARAEAGRVVQLLQRVALANPGVRLILRDGGRELLDLPPARDLLERSRQVYGEDFAGALVPVAAVRGEVSVGGFVSHPAAAVRRARRNAFAVNGRPFESFEIRRLLSTTFAPVLTGGSHVEAILQIRLPSRDVDANVSPDKSHVRFRRPGQVLAAVSDALRAALGEEEAIARFAGAPVRGEGEAGPTPAAWAASLPREAQHWTPLRGGGAPDERRVAVASALDRAGGTVSAPSLRPHPRHGIPENPSRLLQLCDAYILCPVAAGLLIVDQHSAHERVHYERLRERLRRLGRDPEVQSLIFPEPLRLEAAQLALLSEMEPFLRRLGFDLVAGGPREYLVQAAPAILSGRSLQRALADLMDVYSSSRDLGVLASEVGDWIDPLEERMLRTLACHAAVKAGQPLSDSEMRALWSSLAQTELAGHDVHGRPAVLLLEGGEIARRLGRSPVG